MPLKDVYSERLTVSNAAWSAKKRNLKDVKKSVNVKGLAVVGHVLSLVVVMIGIGRIVGDVVVVPVLEVGAEVVTVVGDHVAVIEGVGLAPVIVIGAVAHLLVLGVLGHDLDDAQGLEKDHVGQGHALIILDQGDQGQKKRDLNALTPVIDLKIEGLISPDILQSRQLLHLQLLQRMVTDMGTPKVLSLI